MLVLSDGLGGSEYVKTEIQKHHLANRPANGPKMLILKSLDPRLAVVKGSVGSDKLSIGIIAYRSISR
jgi:hypothetical protein